MKLRERVGERLRAALEDWYATPFGGLTRHFFRSFFDTDSTSEAGEFRMSIAYVLGAVATPGAIMAVILMFQKYSPLLRWLHGVRGFDTDIASIPDKYTFLIFSTVLTGIVTVLKWDRLFPDRRDYQNLIPLPLATRKIFVAKVLALSAFIVVFVTALNAIPSFLFPLVVLNDTLPPATAMELMRFVAAHAVSNAAAGLFVFFSFLAITGTLMSLFPYGWFRRISRYVQFLTMGALLLGFFASPLAVHGIERLRHGADDPVSLLPPVWFLGLYYRIQGKSVGLEWLTNIALAAVAVSFLAAVVAYVASYRRYFLKSAESPELAITGRRVSELALRGLDRLLANGFERACLRYTTKTLMRNDRHAAVIAAVMGLALALAVQAATEANGPLSQPMISVPLIVVYFLAVGLRLAFGIPADTRANWVFRVSTGELEPRRIVRKLTLIYVSAIPLLVFAVYAYSTNLLIAVLHAAFVAFTGAFVADVLMANFFALPCTCSYLPGRNNIAVPLAGVFCGFLIVAGMGASMETYMLAHPRGYVWFYAVFGTIWLVLHKSREEGERVVFEQPTANFELLHLLE